MRRLFLDDVRQVSQCLNYMHARIGNDAKIYGEDWDIVRNYQEFVAYVKENGLPDVVSFDHDLAEAHYDPSTWTEVFEYLDETGLDCVKWLCNYCNENNLEFPTYYIHSMNPVGSKNMDLYIKGYKLSKE